jgi:pyruvate dehydrogenase E2 component (dihydrolipoamide acetyltransferase)
MTPVTTFVLPELGENVAGGDVLRVLVKPGDTVAREQPVLELETDKATIEVPSSVEGRVADVRVKEGQKVSVGDVVLTVEHGAGGETGEGAAPAATEPPAAVRAGREEATAGAGAAAASPAPPSDAMAGQGRDAPTGAPERPARDRGKPRDRRRDRAQASGDATRRVDVALPSLGENVPGGDVLRVLVRAGETIARDQALLELETDKATIEVPSSVEGRVAEVRVKEGDRINVGDVVFVVETSAAAPAGAEAPPPSPSPQPAASPERAAEDVSDEDAVIAGGLQQDVGEVRSPAVDKPGMLEDALEEARADAALRTGAPRGAIVAMPPREDAPRKPAPAAPSVRRTARELGVDINQVSGTGPGGRISADDVKAHVRRAMATGGPRLVGVEARSFVAQPALPDFTKWGAVERKPMRAVRRKTAEHLSAAWATIPHVTQCDKADITDLEALRSRYAARADAAGAKLTVTAIALKVAAAALRTFPQFNASIDLGAEEIVYKQYVHIGVAVDTDRGLLVPVIRDVDKKGIIELSVELAKAADRARAGKATLEEMQGGSFTITNLGGIGGTYFTPIINLPEVAILGISRAQTEPVWKDGAFEPRLRLPLSLSYDHRVIDGADAIRFVRWVAEALEQPFLLSL